MQYDVYRPTDATDEAFDETHKFFVQVEEEDKFLCVRSLNHTSSMVQKLIKLHRLMHKRTWRQVYISRDSYIV